MYHTKRRYSAANKMIKSCKRMIYTIVSFLHSKTEQNTSITGKLFAHAYYTFHQKMKSLGIKGVIKVVTSFVSIFLFIVLIILVSKNNNTLIFADNQLDIKEIDDAYISLDGAILDADDEFGGRFAYIVKPGDTLESLAREFGVTVTSLKSVNSLESSLIKPGQEIIISNVDGFVYEIKEQTSIRDFASKYLLDLNDLKELNSIQNDNDRLNIGDELFVPLTLEEGKKLGLIIPETEPQLPDDKPIQVKKPTTTKKSSIKKPTKSTGRVRRVSQTRAGCFGFVPGQCTCYAAQQRPDIFVPGKSSPWRGNAKARYNNAKSAGYKVGSSPAVGAIAVMSYGRGGYGHVGIVIDISDDEVLIRSMNYVGPYIVSDNRVAKSRIRGYIY